jgi:DNA-binding response OmpR family regulator
MRLSGENRSCIILIMKVLIVEDDERIAAPIKEELEHQQYLVDTAFDGENGLSLASQVHYDLILLDIMLPKLNGLDLCRRLRQDGCKSAIVMLTARDRTAEKIEGLDAGADDYLVKPFEIDELLARIRAVMRRNSESRDPVLRWSDLVLDPITCEVQFQRKPINLTPTEFRLLAHFLRNPNRTFNKDELVARLWLPNEMPTDTVVKAHIKGLRNKLERAGAPRNMIETIYGFGYRLSQNVQ